MVNCNTGGEFAVKSSVSLTQFSGVSFQKISFLGDAQRGLTLGDTSTMNLDHKVLCTIWHLWNTLKTSITQAPKFQF